MNKKCKNFKKCNNEITGRSDKIYCSKSCYIKYRWHNLSSTLKEKNKEKLKSQRYIRKKELITLKGNKCTKCGYNSSVRALDFHHISGKKEEGISRILNYKMETIIKELKKCVLLCSNCHIKEHSFLNVKGNDFQNKLRMFLQEQSGGKCSNCNAKDPRVLEFHHINHKNKKFSISKAIASRWHLEKVVPEVEQCTLLCSNCHREYHDDNFTKKIKMNKIKIKKEEINNFIKKHGKERVCKMCSDLFYTTRHSYFFCKIDCETKYNKKDYENKYRKQCNSCSEVYLTKSRTSMHCFKCLRIQPRKFTTRKIRKNKKNKKKLYNKKCSYCNNQFISLNKKIKNCSLSCKNESIRKYKDKLLLDLKKSYIKNNYNLVLTGKELNITDNAVKKNLIKYFPNEWDKWQILKLKHHKCKSCSKKILKSKGKFCSQKCKYKIVKRYKYDKKKIQKQLKLNDGNISKTARDLNISRKALSNWISKNI